MPSRDLAGEDIEQKRAAGFVAGYEAGFVPFVERDGLVTVGYPELPRQIAAIAT